MHNERRGTAHCNGWKLPTGTTKRRPLRDYTKYMERALAWGTETDDNADAAKGGGRSSGSRAASPDIEGAAAAAATDPLVSLAERRSEALLASLVGGKRSVQFGSNIDVASWDAQMARLRASLPSWMLWRGSCDVLSRLRQRVLGMNEPQLYCKVPGVWTGGHEENLRFRSINVNHGPGSSEWCVEKRGAAAATTASLPLAKQLRLTPHPPPRLPRYAVEPQYAAQVRALVL